MVKCLGFSFILTSHYLFWKNNISLPAVYTRTVLIILKIKYQRQLASFILWNYNLRS